MAIDCDHRNGFSHCSECCDSDMNDVFVELTRLRTDHEELVRLRAALETDIAIAEIAIERADDWRAAIFDIAKTLKVDAIRSMVMRRIHELAALEQETAELRERISAAEQMSEAYDRLANQLVETADQKDEAEARAKRLEELLAYFVDYGYDRGKAEQALKENG